MKGRYRVTTVWVVTLAVLCWMLLLLLPVCSAQLQHTPHLTKGSWVQIKHFVVPRFVGLGHNASLVCDYLVLQDASLYSLKWYKGSSQFYQYIPSKTPPHATFSVQGIKQGQVVGDGDGRRVSLVGVEVAASDLYRCELVAEGPPFHTTQRSANMTVVVLPGGPPVITGSRNYYHHNERLTLNCTTPPSRPAATLLWTVNDRPVSGRVVGRLTNPAGLERLTTQLSLRITPQHFRGGAIAISCEGRLAHLYSRAAHVRILEPSSRWFTSPSLYTTAASSSFTVSWCCVVLLAAATAAAAAVAAGGGEGHLASILLR